MAHARRTQAALAMLAAAMLLVYLPTVTSHARQWASADNNSHGFIVAPFAAWFAWQRRGALSALPAPGHWLGIPLVAASLCVFAAGQLGAELFLARVSLIGVLAGAIVFVWGWRHLRLLLFPLAFLLLMIPLPAVVFNQIAFPLQLLASRVGETVLSLAGVPVLREGNLLMLPSVTLEVAQACSGIRSLVSLLTLAVLLGTFTGGGRMMRAALALSSVPVAIAANAARVAGTGLAAHWIGPQAAEGFLHEFSGWVVFAAAFALLLAIHRAFRGWPGVHLPASGAVVGAS
jgi:exosortase